MLIWELKTSALNPFPHIDTFGWICSRQLLKTVGEKGEIPHNEQFLLLTQCVQLYSIVILSHKEIFLKWCLDVFKVVCFRCFVYYQGLTHKKLP